MWGVMLNNRRSIFLFFVGLALSEKSAQSVVAVILLFSLSYGTIRAECHDSSSATFARREGEFFLKNF
ncbi:hypothetical protein Pr1d_09460 [Bythopirellula goksoeyrii]|uniref:Uncharacterized protein n=1 Tax=Bythopirellula goksoeyrii TaxID=1400387 RepID=A0A5B9Q8C4_9BACT|nr:hypothetical protein Pr1d_09460 [Bythopirellula goksoeyrii]